MHITIQQGRSLPELKRCTTCCKDFHLLFCSSAFFHLTKLSKVRTHLASHFSRAVLHEAPTNTKLAVSANTTSNMPAPTTMTTTITAPTAIIIPAPTTTTTTMPEPETTTTTTLPTIPSGQI
ncbi:Metacaspase-3 [Labeo rohita]|uniref:Metacaspase-3 n=1 Tax=Labeo rohita TaxID=84645 RepID=A0ABQ8LA22_LABRO|nr:Metacaspase-3 [Labeo rohita]